MTLGALSVEGDAPTLVSWSPVNGKIPIRDGRKIDATGERWVVRTPTATHVIDWTKLQVIEGDHRNAIRRWVAHLLRTRNPTVARGGFAQALTLFNSPAFLAAAVQREIVPYLAFSQAQTQLRSDQRWQLHYARDFYRWCKDQQFPYFSRDVVVRLDGLVIGGNPKGEAVRSADPDKGPLNAMEVASLALALRAARLENSMPLNEQAAVWLALAFGANASQFAMMRESDVEPQYLDGQLVTTLVHVPRHKKRHVQPRSELRTRKANRFVGQLLLDLIRSNEEEHPQQISISARPLFWRKEPLSRGGGLEEWDWHLTAEEFTKLLKRAIKRLRVRSRSGTPLHASPRRLRYSMASRMVQEGASKYAVAAALDHTDLQNVDTYFDVASDIVDHLDRAMALELGARAQAFAKLVRREEDAVNGNRPTSRRYYADRKKDILEPIGTCGHNFLCNVAAPYACYACPKFQAWMDGPHDLVLDALVESRNRREQLGLDLRIVAIEDELIAQVAEVIRRIASKRAEAGGDA